MNSPRIAIVGAGAAGISAAARLVENGFDNIIILEAEDRIGGRINTAEIEGNLVDLGAQYCRENSFVYSLIKDYDLLEPRKAGVELYHSKHGRLPDNFVLELLGRFDALYNQKEKDISWEQYIQEEYSKCVVDHFEDERDKLLAQNCLSFIENVFTTNLGVTSLSSSGQKIGELPIAFTLQWKTGGYRSALRYFNEKISQSRKRFKN
ncbi:hypothetical protein RI129_012940 [Pyrocoelia pectoralis]|uniref:Amine oxidase domain-containing protein n=1 Tax=Pyrocoelia pectoralis TaxID=417401 RepID=A0AAN7Z707_9COLE